METVLSEILFFFRESFRTRPLLMFAQFCDPPCYCFLTFIIQAQVGKIISKKYRGVLEAVCLNAVPQNNIKSACCGSIESCPPAFPIIK